MKQIEGVLSYQEAKPYIETVKKYLRSWPQLEAYSKSIQNKIFTMDKISSEKGKKVALLHYDGKVHENFDVAYDTYLEELTAELYRVEDICRKLAQGLECMKNEFAKKTLLVYYRDGCTLEEATKQLAMSMSTVSRFKKIGLARIAEYLFGIMIDM